MSHLPSAKWIETFATFTLAICAVAVTGLVFRREFSPPEPTSPKPVFVEDWERFAVGGERLGRASAPVTVVVFSDYQCPYCRQLAATLNEVLESDPNGVTIIYRHYPLSGIHPHARGAAVAAGCASAQDRFPAFHDLLFQQQDSLGMLPWTELASRAAVPDTSAFRVCLGDGTTTSKLQADSIAAASLGITVTPTIIVNGWQVDGSPPEPELEELISNARGAR